MRGAVRRFGFVFFTGKFLVFGIVFGCIFRWTVVLFVINEFFGRRFAAVSFVWAGRGLRSGVISVFLFLNLL